MRLIPAKLTKYVLGAIASLTVLAGTCVGAGAVTTADLLPSGGVGLALSNGSSLEVVTADSGKDLKITALVDIDPIDLPVAEEVVEEPSEEETFANLVIAQVSKYVNVRDEASEHGSIVGKLYNNSVGDLIAEEDGWYLIESGSVTGYVKAEYCVTGDEAIELAKEVGTRYATVTTTTLKVRSGASLDDSVIALVPLEEDYVVLDETEGWIQIDAEEGPGWVSADYVTLRTEFVHAESKAEEEARLAKEAEARRQAQAAAAASSNNRTSSNSTSSYYRPSTYSVVGTSESGKEVAEYALQFVGNPYKWGGSSLTKGTDCSGFVMSVYANFGVSLPHSSKSDRSQGSAVGSLSEAEPGDLICYSGHVALYIGDGLIVHAANKKSGIIVSNADYRKILAIRRIL